MKSLYTLFLFGAIVFPISALFAQNLVPNPSFEDFSQCPTTGGELTLATPWLNPSSATPDYFNPCSTNQGIGTPNNFVGSEAPLTGQAYAGIVGYSPLPFAPNYREYMQIQLLEPLIAGNCYSVSFNVSLAENSDLAIDNIAAHFSVSPPSIPTPDILSLTPHILSNGVVNVKNGWVNINGTYPAVGGEQYITIGVFVSNFELQIENANGPENYAYYYVEDVEVIAASGDLTAAISPPDPITCDDPSIVLDASGSSSGPGITYFWEGPFGFTSTLQNPTVDQPGTYTLTVFDGICEATEEVQVIVLSVAPDIFITSANPVLNCFFPSVIIQGNSTTPGVSFQWQGGGQNSSNSTITVTQPGTYTLTVTAPNGCSSTEDIVITEDNTPPDVAINGVEEINCITSAITLAASGSPNIVGFTWTDPNNVESSGTTITATEGGEYIVSALAQNGCTSTASVIVPENLTPPLAAAGPDQELGCEGTPLTISADTSNQGGNIGFEWFDPAGNSLGEDVSYAVNIAGEYILSVTDSTSGCIATDTVEIFAPSDLPVAVIEDSDTITCSLPTLILDATNSTGDSLAFAWLAPDSTLIGDSSMVEVSLPGIYQLTITNLANGCSASATDTIVANLDVPIANAGPDGVLSCNDPSITLDGTNSAAGSTIVYQWENSQGDSLGNAPTLLVDQVGVYQLIVTDTINGCASLDSVAVVPDSNFVVASIQPASQLTCVDSLVILDASGSETGPNITYTWLDENNTVIADTVSTSVSQPGIYSLVVENTLNGCSATASVEIQQDITAPAPEITGDSLLTCAQTDILLLASDSLSNAPLSFSWTLAGGQQLSDSTSLTVTTPGTYSLLVTNSDNGCTATDQFQVDLDDQAPQAVASTADSLTCQNTEAILSAAGSSSGPSIIYNWQDLNGTPLGDELTLVTTQPGIYTLIVTDTLNGCVSGAQTTVVQDTLSPIADAGSPQTLTCTITSISLDGSGSSVGNEFSYTWLDQNGLPIASTPSTSISQPGTYSLEVLNTANGCLDSATVAVALDTLAPLAQIQTSGEIDCQSPTVTLQSAGSSTGPNFVLEWQNANGDFLGDQPSVLINQGGLYTLLLTNTNNGCTATETTTVLQDLDIPVAQIGLPDTITCSNPLIELDASSSTTGPTISLAWLDPNNQTIADQQTLQTDLAGTYQLTVTDNSNGCVATTQVVVVEDITPPAFQFTPPPQINCTNTVVAIDALGFPTDSPLSFAWLDENGLVIGTDPGIVVDEVATYTLVLTNLNTGCFTTDSIEVTQDVTPPIADAGTNGTLTCDELIVALDGSNASTGTSFVYLWQNEQGDTLGTNLVEATNIPGTYQFTVLNTQNGCLAQDEVEVAIDTLSPIANASVSGLLTCTQLSVALSAAGSTSGPAITYQWMDANGIPFDDDLTVQVGQAGLFSLMVTNTSNGCSQTANVVVEADTIPPTAQAGPPVFLDCNTTSSFLSGVGSSTGTSFAFAWTDEQGTLLDTTLTLPVSDAGIYELVVTNLENGCTASDFTEVFLDVELPVVAITAPTPLDCANLSTVLDGAGSSLGANFVYSWTGPGILTGANTLLAEVNTAGIYTLTIINTQNGCSASQTTEVLIIDDAPVADIDFEPGSCVIDNAFIDIFEVQGGEAPYVYSIDGGQTFQTTNQFVNLLPGGYSIVVEDSRGCQFEESIFIPQIALPAVFLEANIELSFGETTTLVAQTNVPQADIESIQWSPASGLSCDDCLNPQVNITEDQLYEVQITTLDGCVVTARTLVQINRQSPKIYIPNVFSPNEDGRNDRFGIFSNDPQIVEIRTFQVFSRWGELLYQATNFQPNDPATAWDGTFRAEAMNPGVYIYWFEVEFISGEIQLYKGDVTLVR